MLDRYQRAMVESIKDADTLKITVGGGVESKTSNSASTCAGSTSTNSVTI